MYPLPAMELESRLQPDPLEVPGYELRQLIGLGRFGEVWLAREVATDMLRAAKLCSRDNSFLSGIEPGAVRRYQQTSHNHPNLLQILYVGETDRLFFCIMEVADNALQNVADAYTPLTLREKLNRHQRLEPLEALQITAKLLDGLAQLHSQKLAHNDVKPANVIFIEGQPKLADLGLNGKLGSRLRAGTRAFMPPDGDADDLYSMGKVLYELTTGLPPNAFPRLPRDVIKKPGPALRRAVAISNRACAPKPADRYGSVWEFRADVQSAVDPPGPAETLRQVWSRMPDRLKAAASLGALALVAISIAFSALVFRSGSAAGMQRNEIDLQTEGALTFVAPTSSQYTTYPYLHVNGSPFGQAGKYVAPLYVQSEAFFLDFRLAFSRPWGSLQIGICEDQDGLGGAKVAIMGQPGGEGLCMILSTYDRHGRVGDAEDILGHPQSGLEYVVRLGRANGEYILAVWPLARESPYPVVRRMPVPDPSLQPKFLTLDAFSADSLAGVELKHVSVVRCPPQFTNTDFMQADRELIEFQPAQVPPLKQLKAPYGVNLLAGDTHPYDSGMWTTWGAGCWWNVQQPEDKPKEIRCKPFSAQKREEYSGDERVYGGWHFLRFDGARFGSFKATMHIRLPVSADDEDAPPFVTKSHAGSTGLAFGLQDSSERGFAWGGGLGAHVTIEPSANVLPTAHITRQRGFDLDAGAGDFSGITGKAVEELSVVQEAHISRDELLDPDGFSLTVAVEGKRVRMEINGRTVLIAESDQPVDTSGRIALKTFRLVATFDSLVVEPLGDDAGLEDARPGEEVASPATP